MAQIESFDFQSTQPTVDTRVCKVLWLIKRLIADPRVGVLFSQFYTFPSPVSYFRWVGQGQLLPYSAA